VREKMPINIWGRYKKNPPEIIDTAESIRDAEHLVGEYRMAYGSDWLVWHGRRKDGERTKDGDVSLRGDGNVLRLHEHLRLRR
jgi:hypothetical protein